MHGGTPNPVPKPFRAPPKLTDAGRASRPRATKVASPVHKFILGEAQRRGLADSKQPASSPRNEVALRAHGISRTGQAISHDAFFGGIEHFGKGLLGVAEQALPSKENIEHPLRFNAHSAGQQW